MPLSKIWERIKKPALVFFGLAVFMIIPFSVLHYTGGAAKLIFTEILRAFPTAAIFTTTLSMALFSYIDNISKDLLNTKGSADKIQIAIDSLAELKREVIANAALMICLLIIELSIKGLHESLLGSSSEEIKWLVLSARFSLFLLALWAAAEQVRGLLVAIDYRSVLHRGESSNK